MGVVYFVDVARVVSSKSYYYYVDVARVVSSKSYYCFVDVERVVSSHSYCYFVDVERVVSSKSYYYFVDVERVVSSKSYYCFVEVERESRGGRVSCTEHSTHAVQMRMQIRHHTCSPHRHGIRHAAYDCLGSARAAVSTLSGK